MKKIFKTTASATKAAVGAFKAKYIESRDMYKDKKYIDVICDALYALPDEVDYSGVQDYVIKAIAMYEKEYNVKYSHPFILPENTVE